MENIFSFMEHMFSLIGPIFSFIGPIFGFIWHIFSFIGQMNSFIGPIFNFTLGWKDGFSAYKKDVPKQTSDSQNEICNCTVCVSNRRMFLFFL